MDISFSPWQFVFFISLWCRTLSMAFWKFRYLHSLVHLKKSRRSMRQISLRQIFSLLESYQLLSNILLCLLMCCLGLCYYLTMAGSQSCCSVPNISPAPFHPFNSLSLVFTAELIFGECFTQQTKVYCRKKLIERKEGASKVWLQFIGDGSETEELLCSSSWSWNYTYDFKTVLFAFSRRCSFW